ncbi:hypothetical protein RF55_15452 [Lasius niger]|uniref:Uncharacterized protein n=1 Tax=Lasius niger TaxID=67767 RepID=A0A0J7K5N1_LASNI|nr:hypothetical protein RF55_15452 [Lasius niger]
MAYLTTQPNWLGIGDIFRRQLQLSDDQPLVVAHKFVDLKMMPFHPQMVADFFHAAIAKRGQHRLGIGQRQRVLIFGAGHAQGRRLNIEPRCLARTAQTDRRLRLPPYNRRRPDQIALRHRLAAFDLSAPVVVSQQKFTFDLDPH